jgi:hypothetical protein
MRTLKIIGITLVGIIVLAVLIAYLLPRHLHVERSAVITASPEVVFEQVNVLKNWEKWSPWHRIDPEMEIIYTGPESGEGAVYAWSSIDPSAWQGKLTITESIPHSLITTEIDFVDQGTATSQYTFRPVEDGTLLTWSMDTDMGNNPVARYFGLFMDKLLGKDFEKGLQNIQEVVNSIPDEPAD